MILSYGQELINGQSVDIALFYKYNVIRFQIVRTALDHVIYFATDEDGDLIKVMIVVVYFFCLLICQMKETEFAVQVSIFSHIVPLSVPPRIYIGLSIESLYENGIICKKYSIIYVEYGNNACYDKDI